MPTHSGDAYTHTVVVEMALAPWNVLGGGKIRTDAEEQKRLESGEHGRSVFADWKRTESERNVCLALEKVAAEIGAKSITSGKCLPLFAHDDQLKLAVIVAIAWVMQKAPYVFPIIGGRKVEHLHANIEALEISLTPEQISTLDNVVPFVKGFPFSNFVSGFCFVYVHILILDFTSG